MMVRRYLLLIILAVVLLALAACEGQRGSNSTPHRVVYRVTGSATEAALTYGNLQRGSEQRTVALPWERTLETSNIRLAWITARNTGREGTIRCEVVIDGRVASQAESEGAFKVVSCGSPTRE
jgi:hypothetical protein